MVRWTASVGLAALLGAGAAAAEPPKGEPLVPAAELRERLRRQADTRSEQKAALRRALGLPQARQALEVVGLPAEQVEGAIAALDDEELADLAARAERFERDVAAGALNNQQLTYIVIALATAVIVLVLA